MTLQEIFTKVATHLLTQNAQSISEEGDGCVYRGPDGKMCAVGCLLADEWYDKELEYVGVNTSKVQRALQGSGVPINKDTVRLLSTLQVIHDAEPPRRWKENLEALAEQYNLEMP